MSDLPEKVSAKGLLRELVEAVAVEGQTSELTVVELTSWFDSKWLWFGGKTLGALGVWKMREPVVPPFHPNRILSERHFTRDAEAGCYFPMVCKKALHGRRRSEDNLRQPLSRRFTDVQMFWIAADPEGHGAVMHYRVSEGECHGWYLGLRWQGGVWKVERTQGIAPAAADRLLRAKQSRGVIAWEQTLATRAFPA